MRGGGFLPHLSARRPVMVVMALLACCALGVASWFRIPVQLFPSGFDFPYLWIWADYRNATPREVEEQILKPVEEELATLPRLRSHTSRARVNSVSFDLEFQQDTDMAEAYNQAQDRLDRARLRLPADFDRFFVYKYDPTDEPISWIGVQVPAGVKDLPGLVEDRVKRRLERVPGVARVAVSGADPPRFAIDFHAEEVERRGVDLVRLLEALVRDDFVLPGGEVVEGGRRVFVRSLGRFRGLDDLRRWPVQPGIVLADVADVTWEEPGQEDIDRINGAPAIAIEVYKESQANTVEVGEEVRRLVTEELPDTPELAGWTFHPFFDQAKLIKDSLDNLAESGLEGGFLAILVIVLFLRRWRMTAVIALAIPVSTAMTLTVLYATGGTLNVMSLMGLMLSVGMVVDNSIVVVENIYRLRELGVKPVEAAVRGAAEVALALTLSTGTSAVVFLPLIFMGSDAEFSFFMGAAGLPVCYALGASLIVALLFIPLATLTVARGAPAPEPAFSRWLAGAYERVLRGLLRRRADAGLAFLLLFLSTFVVMGLTPEDDRTEGNLGDVVVSMLLPPNLSFDERLQIVTGVEGRYLAKKDEWRIRAVKSRSGQGSTRATVQVFLEDRGPEDLTREEIVEAIEEDLPRLPGCELWVGWSRSGRKGDAPVVTLFGEDSDRLEVLAREVRQRLLAVPAVQNAEIVRAGDAADELRVQVLREEAARHGLSTAMVARTLGFALRGVDLPPMWQGERPVEVLARYRESDREGLTGIGRLRVAGAAGERVPLAAVADLRPAKGYGEIRRQDGKTSLPIDLQLREGDEKEGRGALGKKGEDAEAQIARALAEVRLPRGYTWSTEGSFAQQEEEDAARQFALLMSIVLVYLLMGMLFESALLPLSILMSIPFAFFGVYWMLFLTGTAFDLMAGIGLVILIGVVVNNAIVLVDRVQRLRHEGVDRLEALVLAGRQRMRPILMTAGTTVFGLVPLAVGQANLIGIPYHPLARAVIGGLVASTILTLGVVPLTYLLFDDLRATGLKLVRYLKASAGGAPVRG